MRRDSRTLRQVTVLGWTCVLVLAWGRPVAAEARVPLLSDAEAWQRLPKVEEGTGGRLPAWARALAASLPRTTAAMLELDWRHRSASPLDDTLRGKLRWTVARANQCEYSMAYAAADLARAGLEKEKIRTLDQLDVSTPLAQRAALAFARKLTLAGSTVTDDEVAALTRLYGDKQLVAIVLLVAFANFQDRLVLALGLEVEPDGPLPPIEMRFSQAPDSEPTTAPERTAPAEQPDEQTVSIVADFDWLSAEFDDLQDKLEAQRCRPTRIAVPGWEEVRELLPPGPARERPLGIRWSLVCIGYQPELARGWSACTRSFAQEAKQDRVFEESLFWVITRSIDCFY
jgi:alkylhydroperoxidase family enzyme